MTFLAIFCYLVIGAVLGFVLGYLAGNNRSL